jgi:hypothetical protein
MQISSISIRLEEHEQMLTVILKLMYNQPIPYIFPLGFQSLRVKVTNDWIKNKVAKSF